MRRFLDGFIVRDSGGKDVFVHIARLNDRTSALSARDKLSSSMFEGRKGPEPKPGKGALGLGGTSHLA